MNEFSVLTGSCEMKVAPVGPVTHSAVPSAVVLLTQNTRSPVDTSQVGKEESGPGSRSATRTVPSGVPSVSQSSLPFVGVIAVKYSPLAVGVRDSTSDDSEPG